LPELLKGVAEEGVVSVLCYADDLVLFSENFEAVQRALDVLAKYCGDFKIEVNVEKTKVVKFRRGGRLKRTDVLLYMGEALEFVNCYEYLGVLLQQSWTFTKHLRKRKVKMMARMGMIRNLDRLSMKGAERFFNVMLRPIVTYAVQSFWLDLKFNHFEILDSCKLLFYKRVMGLSKGARNRKVILLLNEIPLLTEDLAKIMPMPITEEYASYVECLEEKLSDVDPEFFLTSGMVQDNWRAASKPKRLCSTAPCASIHGFHHIMVFIILSCVRTLGATRRLHCACVCTVGARLRLCSTAWIVGVFLGLVFLT
jgi:hypothetical protein